jgi:hypothetical protein
MQPGLEKMAESGVSREPGWGLLPACLQPGPTAAAGYQTRPACIPLAWLRRMQATEQALSHLFLCERKMG